jgi:long-chain acyl-CoA synthetase
MDSLGWIDFTLALERDLGVTLTEKEIARVVTLRDLLHEALAASDHAGRASALTTEQLKWLAALAIPSLVLSSIGESLIRVVMRFAFTLRIEGREHLPATGPFLVCPNHASYLDPFAVAAALPHRQLRRTYWAGWTGILFTTPLRRLFSRLARVLPVDPDRAFSSNIVLPTMALERGDNLVWFPEGARSPDGSLQKFQPGVGALLERKPVPVVPVLIRGTYEAWPLGQKFPKLRPVSVRFCPVIDPSGLAPAETGRERPQHMADAIRAALVRLPR